MPGSRFIRYPYGDAKAFSSTFPVSATIRLSSVLRVATPYPTTEPQHLPLSTASSVTAGTFISHAHARSDPYLTVTRSTDVQDSCHAVVWDKRRRSHIESHVEPVFQTAARGNFHILHSAPEGTSIIVRFGPGLSVGFPSRVGWTPTYSIGTASSRRYALPQYRWRRSHLSEIPLLKIGHE